MPCAQVLVPTKPLPWERRCLTWLSQLSWADRDSYEQQAQKHRGDLHVEDKDFGVKAGVVWVGLALLIWRFHLPFIGSRKPDREGVA